MPHGLPRSASLVAGENGPSARRAFGHAASPRRCTRHPGLPVSRARRSLAAPPDCALVCFAAQNDPAASSVFRVRSRRLPARLGKPTVKPHTHECGSISSGWPPNQPASRIAKLFGEGSGGGESGQMFDDVLVASDAPGKLLRPASRRLRRP